MDLEIWIWEIIKNWKIKIHNDIMSLKGYLRM